MLQKITYRSFLIIGISILILSNSCNKKTKEIGLQSAEYTFTNNLSDTLKIEIYNKSRLSSTEYRLLPFDHITFFERHEGQAYPFMGGIETSVKGDSVVIRFKDEKCVRYNLDLSSGTYGGDGVFDLKEYDNYSSDLVKQKEYTLQYTIDSTDYKKAVPCN